MIEVVFRWFNLQMAETSYLANVLTRCYGRPRDESDWSIRWQHKFLTNRLVSAFMPVHGVL